MSERERQAGRQWAMMSGEQNPESPAEQSRPPEARKNIESIGASVRRVCYREHTRGLPSKTSDYIDESMQGFAMPSNRLPSSTRSFSLRVGSLTHHGRALYMVHFVPA